MNVTKGMMRPYGCGGRINTAVEHYGFHFLPVRATILQGVDRCGNFLI